MENNIIDNLQKDTNDLMNLVKQMTSNFSNEQQDEINKMMADKEISKMMDDKKAELQKSIDELKKIHKL